MSDAPYSTDPLAWEIRPGLRIGDLESVEQCEEAILRIDADRDAMLAQIAEDEANPGKSKPGWRTKVGSALRWKLRVRKAINVRAAALRPPKPVRQDERRKVLLAVIFDEVGEEEFARFAALAEERNPQLFQGGGDVS